MRKTFSTPALLSAVFLIGTFAACGGENKENEKDLCAGVTCPEDQSCDPASGACAITPDDKCANVTCTDGQACNPATGQCEGANPNPPVCGNNVQEPGEDCDGGEDCDENCHLIVKSDVCAELTISGSDACELTGSGDKLLIRGDILTSEKIYKGGSVLVGTTGKIECVGCECSAEGARVITCPNAAVSPGLINAHEHLTYSNNKPANWGDERFDHRHDWRKGKRQHTKVPGPQTSDNVVVELRMLMGGATSMFGSGDVSGLMRNVDSGKEDESMGIASDLKPVYQTFPLGDSGGDLFEEGCGEYNYHNSVKNFDNSCPYGPHVAEGIDKAALNELYCLSGQDPNGHDIFQSKAAFIHGIAATPEIIAMMAQSGTKLIWSPRTNISLYGDTAQVTVYDRLGVTIGLGTDWIYSGSMNMLRELKCVDYMNKNHYNNYFSDKKIWQMSTINSAIALGIESALGDLKVGLLGDIAIFRATDGRSDYRAVIEADAQDVLLVARAGKILYGDANLIVDADCDAVDVCGSAKKACTQKDTGKNYETISGLAKYPLFFCGTPDDEPTCVPQRKRPLDTTSQNTTMYEGAVSAQDSDGDGIPDSEDNCPTIFNPVRPGSGGRQADYDNDGIGDVCDAYPTCKENNSSCPATVDPSAKDTDGDGVPDRLDNCPEVANADQLDTDSDGKGDACDPCPEIANPGDERCPISELTKIADIQQNKVIDIDTACADNNICTTEKEVLIEGIVTGLLANTGFFVQDPSVANGEYAGIYVYKPLVYPKLNDEVSVQGYIGSYYTMVQITGSPMVKVISSGNTPIEATLVNPSDVTTGGAKAKAFSSVLVKVADVEMTEVVDEKYAIWKVTGAGGSVEIDDYLGYSTIPNVGDAFSSITGLLVFDYSKSKIAPRAAYDLVGGEAKARLDKLECPEKLRAGKAGKCTVSLAKAVSSATTVQLSGADNRSVSVEANASSAIFNVTLEESATGTHEVKAWIDDEAAAKTATIAVVAADAKPTKIELTGPATANIGSTIELTVTLDNPSISNFGVQLSLGEGSCGALLEKEITVKAEALTATATFDATGCEADARVVITAASTVESGVDGDSLTVTIAEAPTGKGVVINQIMTRGSDAYDEFVELYNPTSAEIDLSNFVLWKTSPNGSPTNNNSIALTGSIPAQGFYLIASANGLASFDVDTDYVDLRGTGQGLLGGANKNSAFWLTNSNEIPAVGSENLVDLVGLGENISFEGKSATHSDDGNVSVGRKVDGQDTDNNGDDFEQKNPACPRSSKSTTCPSLKS